jgi:hypothetical protein
MSAGVSKGSMGEMRRRHEAIVRSGALARVRSEGRLVFGLALLWADYRTCRFRMSARGAAKISGVQPTTIRRGVAQLISQGVIEPGPKETGKRQIYRFKNVKAGAHEPCPGGAQVVRVPGHEPCAPPDTSRAQGAHEPCAERAPLVSGARTVCAP